MNKFKEKSKVVCKKTKDILKNKKGDFGTSGKIVIGCIGLVFLLGISVYLFTWSKDKVEDTTNQIDTEYSNWSN